MIRPRQKRLVVLGMMSRHPVGGVVWQTLHYLLGFERLGFQTYYVEAGALQPSALLEGDSSGDRSAAAAAFLHQLLDRFGFGDRWAFHALHADGRCYGMSQHELHNLYGSADLIINLHGATIPLPEHYATGRLVYLETDPVAVQIELYDGKQATIDYLEPHCAFFTFGENYGQPGCRLPVSERFLFRPTRQPVVVELWEPHRADTGSGFTTIGNWRQNWREVTYNGEIYHWSKHHEFLKFVEVPRRTGQPFELALSSRYGQRDLRLLRDNGWSVVDALAFSLDIDAYRGYITGSRAEFTVAKDQNIRLRSGWFSDRSATYLAAGRPVITQETGFSDLLPTGEGLFAFSSLGQVESAVEAVNADYERHSRAARAIAREHFSSDVVLRRLLSEVGL